MAGVKKVIVRKHGSTVCGVVLCLLQVHLVSGAQGTPPRIEWESTFGGESYDQGRDVQQTNDGGYIIAGRLTAGSGRGIDVYLIKTDKSGREEWSRTFGGEGDGMTRSGNDMTRSVEQTNDGGYVIGGFGDDGIFLIKTDPEGNEEWTRTFGGEWGGSARQTSDGGYILVGRTPLSGEVNPDVYLVKTDKEGKETWSRTFGSPGWDCGYSVQETTDRGYIIAGDTAPLYPDPPWGDVYLFKADGDGNYQWSRTFSRTFDDDSANTVRQCSDEGYIICGFSIIGVGSQAYVIKTDSQGFEQWSQTFAGSGWAEAHAGLQTSDGGYIVVGGTVPLGGGGTDVYVVKMNEAGQVEWSLTLGGAATGEFGRSVDQARDGGYVIVGETSPQSDGDVYLLKLGFNPAPSSFQRGDSDSSDTLGLADVVFSLSYLFQSGPAPTCLDSADADDNGALQITDPIVVLMHLFAGAGPLPEPFSACGDDPTPDDLDCSSHAPCGS